MALPEQTGTPELIDAPVIVPEVYEQLVPEVNGIAPSHSSYVAV